MALMLLDAVNIRETTGGLIVCFKWYTHFKCAEHRCDNASLCLLQPLVKQNKEPRPQYGPLFAHPALVLLYEIFMVVSHARRRERHKTHTMALCRSGIRMRRRRDGIRVGITEPDHRREVRKVLALLKPERTVVAFPLWTAFSVSWSFPV